LPGRQRFHDRKLAIARYTGRMPDSEIALSLIMATLGRVEPIEKFLDSISAEAPADLQGVELIIVDQNPDERVAALLAAKQLPLQIRRVRSRPGVSLARNFGVAQARGRLLGFPDDDCWYPSGLLRQVLAWFEAHPEADGLSCTVTDHRGRRSAGFMAKRPQWIRRSNVWRCVKSTGLFVRRTVHNGIGGFDENLGLGAATRWGSGEETDYALRAIAAQHRLFYEPALRIFHPRKPAPMNRASLRRAWQYGQGAGYVLQRNGYGAFALAYYASLPLASAVRSVVMGEPGRSLDRLVTGAGRIVGWIRGGIWDRQAAAALDVLPMNEPLPETPIHQSGTKKTP
jgi:glycosyltransferase involved in cell wall biosynthesis